MPYKDREKKLAHAREYSRRHYIKNRDKIRVQHRKYIEENPKRFRQIKNQSYIRHREKRLVQSQDYYKRNRDKILARMRKYHEEKHIEYEARYKANYAIPLDSKCCICGRTENLERHHPDYNKPLNVITVCRSCHVLLHKRGEWYKSTRTSSSNTVLQEI